MSPPQAYQRISEFLSALDESSTSEESTLNNSLFFVRGDRGVTLNSAEARDYIDTLNSLRAYASSKRYLTPRILERLLQDAVLTILGSGPPSSPGRVAAVTTALGTLKKEIARPPEPWTVYLPATGVTVGKRAITFGGARFHPKRGAFEGAIMKAAETISSCGDAQQDEGSIGSETRTRLLELQAGSCVAEVNVRALDSEGAEIEARHIAAEVGAALSFYGRVLSRLSAPIYIGEPPEPRFRNSIAIRKNASISHRSSALGRGASLSLSDLKSNRRQVFQGRWVSRVLAKLSRNSNEERIISAMVWCGRALGHERREMQFLLHAISLETLLLDRKNSSELAYQLRSRAAHLLSKSIAKRESISSDLSKLYAMRSKIVHTGSESITDAQLHLIRSYAIGAIMTCIMTPEIRKMLTEDSLERWFERKILL